MSGSVYHHTDTARLPWILASGELRVGRNRIGWFPDPDFLWATTSPLGDRTASASLDACRKGRVRLVRFVLPADAFEPWRDIVARLPAWMPQHIARLETAALGKSDPRSWRCRTEALPANQWLSIETRGWSDNRWRPLDPPHEIVPLDASTRGVVIGSKLYASTPYAGPFGSVGYTPAVLDYAEDAA